MLIFIIILSVAKKKNVKKYITQITYIPMAFIYFYYCYFIIFIENNKNLQIKNIEMSHAVEQASIENVSIKKNSSILFYGANLIVKDYDTTSHSIRCYSSL